MPTARSAPVRLPARIRWDRVGRIAMLAVLCAILYLYVSAGVSLLSSWRESKRDNAQVVALARQNRALQRQRTVLTGPGTMQAEARRLGMVKPGEQTYVVSGLPSN
jgi:cell division protein FtsB